MILTELLHAVPTSLEARADGSLVVGGLLIQRGCLTSVLSADGPNLVVLSLCIGGIARGTDRRPCYAAGDGAEAGIARTRNDGTEDSARDGADRGVGTRRRTRGDNDTIV